MDSGARAVPRNLEAGNDQSCYLVMEDLLEKLKILNYEKKLLGPKNLKPIIKSYFAVQSSNPNEQFYYFTSLVSWLMGLCGHNFPAPQQYDDPNATAANILMELKQMDAPYDYSQAKLKQAHGDAVCTILSALADRALQKSGFVFNKPVYQTNEYEEEAPVAEDDEECDLVDDVAAGSDDDEELMFSDLAKKTLVEADLAPAKIVSKVDPAAWLLELERVTPLLKVQMQPDNKEWRSHVELTRELDTVITSSLPDTKDALERISAAVLKALDGIATREKYINSHYEHLIHEYKGTQEKLQETQNMYNNNNHAVTSLTNELARISEELEEIKSKMDDAGSSKTNTAPLQRMKNAMAKLTTELKEMELRIGTVEHTLLHTKMRGKGSIHDSAAEDQDAEFE
eukprot:JP435713.1.p1 GENE.JP435713.1~~JP435713.1.p1  ORF type:complete len:425 (+),score=92.54 JP435713.1:80-1276(+)